AIIEVPYVKDLIDRCEFDTIYHEHLSYFSLTALNKLFARHDLAIQEVERLTIHGGSLRIFVGIENGQLAAATLKDMLERRKTPGRRSARVLSGFRAACSGAENVSAESRFRSEAPKAALSGLWCRGKRQHAAKLFRDRQIVPGFRCRSQHL